MTVDKEERIALVRAASKGALTGTIVYRSLALPCALGRGGCRTDKREGDGATPIGSWPVRQLLYRPDKGAPPVVSMPKLALAVDGGWCDAPADRNYNRPVHHPYPASAERLWRTDDLYDLIVVLGYNDAPVVAGRGSAIFIHVAQPDLAPTEGCIALTKADLVRLLEVEPQLEAVRITG